MVTVYIEGGGEDNSLKTACRQAFTKLFEKAGFKGRMPTPIACGSREEAFKKFRTHLRDRGPTELAILLVDAEGPVTHASPWDHVQSREGDKRDKPEGATDDHLHLMVQCMEAWLLADRPTLVKFYGNGFNERALPPATANPEQVHKRDVYDALKSATRNTKTKGRYGKSEHSFKLVAMLDLRLVRTTCAGAERFFATLDGLA